MTAPVFEASPTENRIETLRQSKEFYEQLGDWALEAARAETLDGSARDRHLSSVPIERRRDTELVPDERITKEGRPKSKDKNGDRDPRYWGFQYHDDNKFLGQIEGTTTGSYTIEHADPDPRIGKVKIVMPSGSSPKLAAVVGGFSGGRKKAKEDLEHLPVEDVMKAGRRTGGRALPHKMRAFVEPGLAENQTEIQETTLDTARKLHHAQESLQRALEDRYKVAKADRARGHKVGKDGPVVKGLRKALKEAQKEFDKSTKKPLEKVERRIERINNQAIRKQNWYIKRQLYGSVIKEQAEKGKEVSKKGGRAAKRGAKAVVRGVKAIGLTPEHQRTAGRYYIGRSKPVFQKIRDKHARYVDHTNTTGEYMRARDDYKDATRKQKRADKQKQSVNVQRRDREIVQVYKDGKRVNDKTSDAALPQRKHK